MSFREKREGGRPAMCIHCAEEVTDRWDGARIHRHNGWVRCTVHDDYMRFPRLLPTTAETVFDARASVIERYAPAKMSA